MYYVLPGVLLLLIIGGHSENPNAQQQPNKVAGPGLWNSIGEGLKTPGKAMPTQIHLPHDIENPGMTNKQIIKSYKGKFSTCRWSVNSNQIMSQRLLYFFLYPYSNFHRTTSS